MEEKLIKSCTAMFLIDKTVSMIISEGSISYELNVAISAKFCMNKSIVMRYSYNF